MLKEKRQLCISTVINTANYISNLLMRFKSLINRVCCFAVLAIAVTAVSSCKSTNTATTSVQVINVSPDAGPVNYYLSGNLKTATPVSYGTLSGYFLTVSGNQTGEVKSAAGTLFSSSPVSIGSNLYYTVFISGQTATNNVTSFIAQDNLNTPAPGKAKIRFIHTVAAAPQVNLLLDANVVFSAKAYKSVSDYTEVTPGTYSIRATTSDITAAGVTTAFNQTFDNGKIYNIIFKGAVGATTDALKLSLSVVANN